VTRPDARPDPAALVQPFPHGRSHGPVIDFLRLRLHKFLLRRTGGPDRDAILLPHRLLLSAATTAVRRAFDDPVCIETGCIRDEREGSDSTLSIASALDRGRLYTFELEPEHIEVCRAVCEGYNERIEYVPGDSKTNLRRLRDEGTFRVVHLGFFDSGDEPDLTFEEFRTIEDLFVPGSLAIVDDVIYPGVKGRRIRPYLAEHPDWDMYMLFTWHGMLVAGRR
jgi:hypothetical protein